MNKVLFAGDQEAARKLIREVAALEEFEEEAPGALLCARDAWRLSNKYYEADLRVYVGHSAEGECMREHAWGAMVWVFDASSGHAAASREFWAPWRQLAHDTAPSVHLMVASSSMSEELEQLWEEWCVEEGVEFVCASERSRVAEALEANMWPEMTMAGDKAVGQGEREQEQKQAAEDERPEGYVEFGEFVTAQTMEQAFEGGAEKDFGGVMEAVSQMRDHISQLPDEERREAAAKFALFFAQQLGDLE